MTAIVQTEAMGDTDIPQKGTFHRLLHRPLALGSGIFLIVVVLLCAFGHLIAPHDPLLQDLNEVYQLPNAQHLLGTDQLGRDILSRLLVGGATTLLGALVAVVVYAVLGLIFGVIAGSGSRGADTVIMRICDLVQSIPGLVVLLVILSIYDHNETAAMVTLGIILGPGLVRIVRTATKTVRAEQYVAAARVAGLTQTQIQVRHVLPAVTGPVLTQVSFFAGLAILTEASIGFLGFGVNPPAPSWGNMIADAQAAIDLDAWMLIPSGVTVALVALAFTILGNAIREAYAGRSSRVEGTVGWRQLSAGSARTGNAVAEAVHDALLTVSGLTVRIPHDSRSEGLTIVDGVSFTLKAGESLGIVGESGCGKSMMVSGILRVVPAMATITADQLEFSGKDLLPLSEREMNAIRGNGIAYISQEPVSSLDPVFTAGQQLVEAIRQHRGGSKAQAKVIALQLLAQVRLPDPHAVFGRYPHELSGGMAQRVAIARALAGQPKVLIADEPTTALDVTVQADILDLLRELREQTGMGLIFVTHDWGVLADSCDRALVMYAGQIVETAELRRLVHRPTHPYSAALLNSELSNAPIGEKLVTIPGAVPPPQDWPTSCRFANRCRFATTECSEQRIPLVMVDEQQQSRCIHIDQMLAEEAV